MNNRVIAFYGFKGGSGRSFLLANTAAMLSAMGRRVLVIDSDLEAPGLGDFFDGGHRVERKDSGESSLSSSWRSKKGFLDLMEGITAPEFLESNEKSLAERVKQILDPCEKQEGVPEHEYLTEVVPYGSGKKKGQLFLMGPGRQEITEENGSFDYVARILEFDWVGKIQSEGIRGFKALKEVLTCGLFEHVLIDGRTGYNLASLVSIQNLATDVVMVGTAAMQSIDGIARMRPIFTGTDPNNPDLRAHIVISKGKGSESDPASAEIRDQAYGVKMDLNKKYYHHGFATFHELPFVEDFVTGESQLFGRVDYLGAQESKENQKQRRQYMDYITGFLEFLRDLYEGDPIYDELDNVGMTKTFRCWNDETVQTQSAPQAGLAFGDATSGLRKQDKSSENADDRIEAFKGKIEVFLDSMSVSADGSIRSDDEALIRRTFAVQNSFSKLRIEERAFCQAWVEVRLRESFASSQVMSTLTDILYLRSLPHLVTNLQVEPFFEQKKRNEEPNVIYRQNDYDGRAIDDVGGASTGDTVSSLVRRTNIGSLQSLCRDIVEESEVELDKLKLELNDELYTIDDEYKLALKLLEKLALESELPSADSLFDFADFIAQSGPFLPKTLADLRKYSPLAVGKHILSKMDALQLQGEITGAVTASVRAVLGFFQQFMDLTGEETDDEIIALLVECVDWIKIWSKASVIGKDLWETNFPGYPQVKDLEPLLALAETIVRIEECSLATRIRADILRLRVALVLDQVDTVHEVLAEAMTSLEKLSPLDLPQSETDELRSIAAGIRKSKMAWRMERMLVAARSTARDPSDKQRFDFSAYHSGLLTCFRMGLFPTDLEAFPSLPSQLTSSDQDFVKREIGWYWYGAAHSFGRFRDIVSSDHMGQKEEDSAKLSWLISAYAQLGDIDESRAVFKQWASLVKNKRVDHYRYISGLYAVRESILTALLAAGDIESFDALSQNTDLVPPSLSLEAIGVSSTENRMLLLRRRALQNDVDRKWIAEEAAELMSLAVGQFCNMLSPGDMFFPVIFGGEWDGLGAFSGHEVPRAHRATAANLFLDGLELVAEPDEVYLAMIEQLIWGNDDRATGRADLPEFDPFLKVMEPALLLPRARLECLRSDLGLSSALDLAQDAYTRDCADDLNGPGRGIFYPERLRANAIVQD